MASPTSTTLCHTARGCAVPGATPGPGHIVFPTPQGVVPFVHVGGCDIKGRNGMGFVGGDEGSSRKDLKIHTQYHIPPVPSFGVSMHIMGHRPHHFPAPYAEGVLPQSPGLRGSPRYPGCAWEERNNHNVVVPKPRMCGLPRTGLVATLKTHGAVVHSCGSGHPPPTSPDGATAQPLQGC